MQQITQFLQDHKKEVIQITGALIGAGLGIAVTALILSVQDEDILELEEIEELQ